MHRIRELLSPRPKPPFFSYTQISNYVNVKTKWKKDPFYDSLDTVNNAKELRPLLTLKNLITAAADDDPSVGIPISAVSKRTRSLEISTKVAVFLRKYPAVFEEFVGPQYDLPWFKLTNEAADLHREEKAVYESNQPAIIDRLRRLILMSKEKRLPLTVIQGMLYYLGLPEDFLRDPETNSDNSLRIINMGDGLQGLSPIAIDPDEKILSLLQKNAVEKMGSQSKKMGSQSNDGTPPSVIPFLLYPSRGIRLKQDIKVWLDEFQNLPYVSPYEDSSSLGPGSDLAEKRATGLLHELLALFVDHSAERRKLLCLKKHLRLPQKFHKVFERHPHVFYLQLKNKTCTVVLKEAYCGWSIERHPMLRVRKKYVEMMNKSEAIIRRRRRRNEPPSELAKGFSDSVVEVDLDDDPSSLKEHMVEILSD